MHSAPAELRQAAEIPCEHKAFPPPGRRHANCVNIRFPAIMPKFQTTRNMSKLNTLEDLLVQEVKDLYNAENQLVKALPKMAKAASDAKLQKGFQTHLEETKVHVERLEEIAAILDASPKGKVCKAMKGLVEEGAEVIEEEGDPAVKDLSLIIAAQKVEHYEIASYGSARALAEALGYDDVVDLLQATLDEEGATDKKLTGMAEQLIPSAPEAHA